MKKHELELGDEQREELERTRDTDPRAYMRECAAALLKVASGESGLQVAQKGLYKKRQEETLYRWLFKYKKGGIKGLVHKPRGHRGFSPSRGRTAEGSDPPTS